MLAKASWQSHPIAQCKSTCFDLKLFWIFERPPQLPSIFCVIAWLRAVLRRESNLDILGSGLHDFQEENYPSTSYPNCFHQQQHNPHHNNLLETMDLNSPWPSLKPHWLTPSISTHLVGFPFFWLVMGVRWTWISQVVNKRIRTYNLKMVKVQNWHHFELEWFEAL